MHCDDQAPVPTRPADGEVTFTDVFVDGSVRYLNWAAAAWYVSPDRWGAFGYRDEDSTAVEADAIAFGLRCVSGPVRIHSDCKSLVDAFKPDKFRVFEFGWRTGGRPRIQAAIEAAWMLAEGRPVDLVHVPGHARSTPLQTRLADSICRYAIVRAAAASDPHIFIGPDDLPEFAVRADNGRTDVAFLRAVRDQFRNLGIYKDAHSHKPELFVNWRGALRTVVEPRVGEPPERRRPLWWIQCGSGPVPNFGGGGHTEPSESSSTHRSHDHAGFPK